MRLVGRVEMRMTLQQIQYFIAVAECGSVGGASKRLFTAQSTISEALIELERECRIQAFIRSSRGMLLTREGEELLIELSEIQRKLDYVKEKYSNREQVHYSLSVVAQHHICGMDSFLSFAGLHRSASYVLGYKESSTPVVLRTMENGRADIGIIFFTEHNKKQFKRELETRNLQFFKLLTGQIHAYVSRTHPLAHKEEVSIAELVEYPKIDYDKRTSSNGEYTNIRTKMPVRQMITVTDRATAYSLMHDLHAFVVGTGLKTSMDQQQQIVMLPVVDGDIVEIGYILQSKLPISAAVEQFIDLLKTEISLED